MALNFNQIENLLVKYKSDSSLAELIIKYSALKQELEDTENHSWYFKQGIESKMQEIDSLNNHFEKMRALFNESKIDFFINKINVNNEYLSGLEGKGTSFIQRISYSWKVGENELFNELIRLKSKTELLMGIDYYLENPDEFLIFID
ncbi:hypothetical protein [Gelidibacter maritimus]|uniref:Uncharacterized protein n=1 Tax=Gelidibacter maritimus TaxID=2761487 RepID=A0A7W2R4S7_9FLAO|nr:hypothetical protein [Gelidibacter maritimus]MBA6154211.1 hypothetical protein [Gelidibacter maritimus]